mgnify:FL=1
MTLHKTLLIDNYDSFTYNLYQYLGELGANPIVFRNDEISLGEVIDFEPTHIVFSPGPGTVERAKDFGICEKIITQLDLHNIKGMQVPLLGVCLGHQGIIAHFGGKIEHAPEIIHGKRSQIVHDGSSALFKNIPREFEAMRYHSLIGTEIPKQLRVTSIVKDNPSIILSVENTDKLLFGIQFHPESIGTPEGKKILKNFLEISLG